MTRIIDPIKIVVQCFGSIGFLILSAFAMIAAFGYHQVNGWQMVVNRRIEKLVYKCIILGCATRNSECDYFLTEENLCNINLDEFPKVFHLGSWPPREIDQLY